MNTKSIVVVAANPGTARSIQAMLNSVPGYGSVTVGHGEAALNVIAAVNADLAILDVNLPGIDGPKVRDLLRSRIGTVAIPVLFLSTPGSEDVANCQNLGEVLSLPVDAAELLQRVHELLTIHAEAG